MWLKNGWTTPNPSLRKRKHVGSLLVEDESKSKDLVLKLAEDESKRKSIDAALAGAKKQAEEQHLHLSKAEKQLAIALEKIKAQQRELKGKAKEFTKAEQAKYDVGQKETEVILRSHITEVYQGGLCL